MKQRAMANKGVNVVFDGADALISGFKGMASSVEEDIAIEVEAGVQDIRNDSMRLIPVDTGRARNSISAAANGLKGEVSVNVDYAGYLEWGTGGSVDVPEGWEQMASKWKGKGIKQMNMPPRPFLRPAFEKNVPIILKRMNDAIGGK